MGIAFDIQKGAPNIMAVPKGYNLHRNVILRGDGSYARRVIPLTTQPPLGTQDPLDLYQWLSDHETLDKGNLDLTAVKENYKTHERVYDVAVSDGRTIDSDGRCKTPVGNTVDLQAATWTNTIGASELVSIWVDPDFDPKLKAFYYVRILEIPTR